MYLCQEGGEGGGEGGEKEHIYNHPKGGLVPPSKGRFIGKGGMDNCDLVYFRGYSLLCYTRWFVMGLLGGTQGSIQGRSW